MGFLNRFNGFKTYIAAAIMALNGVLQLLNGDYSGLELIVQAMAIAGLRDGIAKVAG